MFVEEVNECSVTETRALLHVCNKPWITLSFLPGEGFHNLKRCDKLWIGAAYKTKVLRNLLFVYLNFIVYFWLGQVFVAAGVFLWLQQAGAIVQLRGMSFSFRELLLLWSSRHRLSGCDTWAQLLSGMWDLPRPGIKLYLLHRQVDSFTTEPTGKPYSFFIKLFLYSAVPGLGCGTSDI